MSPQNIYSKEMKKGRDGQQASNSQRVVIVSKRSAAVLPFGRFATNDATIANDLGVKLPALSSDITNPGSGFGVVMPTQFIESQAAPNADQPEYYLGTFPANILQRGPCYVHVEKAVTPSDSVYVRYSVNNAPANEVQTVTPNTAPTAGAYSYSFRGVDSPLIAWNANAATILAALQAMMENPELDYGAGAIASVVGDLITGGSPSTVITFGGVLADQPVELLTVPSATNTLTYNAGVSPTILTVTETTPGHGTGGFLGIFTKDTDGGTCALLPNAAYLTKGNPEQDPVLELT